LFFVELGNFFSNVVYLDYLVEFAFKVADELPYFLLLVLFVLGCLIKCFFG
jgi:hypothetical protein